MALAFTQHLTKMGTRNIPGGRARPVRKDDLIAISYDCLGNVGSTTSHNSIFLHGFLLLMLLLWSSGQSFWLQIQRSGFDYRLYQILRSSESETGSTQPRVSTTEELLERKVAAPV
jgi:hypothetical protein